MMKRKHKVLFNEIARNQLDYVIKENGLKVGFAAEKIGISITTLSKWRRKEFDFKEDKLSMVEGFISKYK